MSILADRPAQHGSSRSGKRAGAIGRRPVRRGRHFISRSQAETVEIGRKFGRSLEPGTVVCLEGGLGSGKTTFVKGIARALGLGNPDTVKSPTFVLLHVYKTRIPLYHFDLYRLQSEAELEAIGFEEFLNDAGAIACVEWADKARGMIPSSRRRIVFRVAGEHTRRIHIV